MTTAPLTTSAIPSGVWREPEAVEPAAEPVLGAAASRELARRRRREYRQSLAALTQAIEHAERWCAARERQLAECERRAAAAARLALATARS